MSTRVMSCEAEGTRRRRTSGARFRTRVRLDRNAYSSLREASGQGQGSMSRGEVGNTHWTQTLDHRFQSTYTVIYSV